MSVLTKAFAAMPPRARYLALAYQWWLIEKELRYLDEFVPKGTPVVDVGGWFGPWTYWLARRASHVDTFEPVPHIAEYLQGVVQPNVAVHNLALSDAPGTAVLHVPADGYGSEGRSTFHEPSFSNVNDIKVAMDRLDSCVKGPIGFIKVDVEGHEMQVLRGAEETIKASRPALLVEVECHDDRKNRVDEVVDFMADLGYGATFLQRGQWLPYSKFDLHRDQLDIADRVRERGLLTNTLLTRGYVNNFLFRRSNAPQQP